MFHGARDLGSAGFVTLSEVLDNRLVAQGRAKSRPEHCALRKTAKYSSTAAVAI